MIDCPSSPLALHLDRDALIANWRWLAGQSGAAACGAALKADGYGLGATEVLQHLLAAGCRDFFVATWQEAAALLPLLEGASLSVLHGARSEDLPFALAVPARPVLNSAAQVARWKAAGGGPCDVMIDTGMNRLGLRPDELGAGVLDGLEIQTLCSHLACADETSGLNAVQRARFEAVRQQVPARRYSLANSAGILLGSDYAFDLTRPGLALYGGLPTLAATGHIRPVVRPHAQILQRRRVEAGETVGYGATFTAKAPVETAIVNLGYADGYLRAFAGGGAMLHGGERLPLLGRVSMDLIAVDVSAAPDLEEGDWLEVDYDLPTASAHTGLSQYELLTGLGQRFERRWV
ncbi:alanine racemase [Sphingobium sp. B2D3A]|uniref:alanine racemase n=1 Tax=unclassified Sphingobium TaxID=2611147 RepID=UPI0022254E25|nr:MULTISPECIES: alanine racemase [unclassified Sphingobium]MCW2338003.1 alanine racemase [Sphingobium sp. B2D3A]MCW2384462.1 alanine racemase [Sphingobium sp. B2D3D]